MSSKVRSIVRGMARRRDTLGFEDCLPDAIEEPRDKLRLCPRCRAAAKTDTQGKSTVDDRTCGGDDQAKT